ncbi:hypothetical protein CKM354_001125800 [Cercospora kikuchii]|uniref:Uncharacterized protein n=1 Tax=Cercospora kikuchii TaxID=84275 RepID=A0A9P3CV81_9PEZI|nr:uncharacterized protein CKM354_001125800 [Cercospora kikuchii]GIZ48187.1 hypothetical protein CKM354_001125800 [Cercospora kikuchii]
MALDTSSWSLEDITAANVHDAVSEFEEANHTEIERARADGKERAFPLEKKLEGVMKELTKEILSRYPTADLRIGHPIVAFTSRKHYPIPGFAKTGYVVLKSRELREGSIRWGEDLEVIGEGYYIPFAVK